MITNAVLNDYFLNELFKESTRELFARITVLTQDENAIETIEGKVSGGSINVDGKSAIRRTCSLNLVAKDIVINEFYWGIKNKFKLEIGLLNEVDSNYEDIIWFPQGIFLITNFDVSQTLKDCKITIKGKDKMCLLNGEFAGHLPHETDFGKIDIYDNVTDTVITEDVLIKTIIQEAVRNFGGELPQNIIINDIENAGLELLEYRGKTPMYMFRQVNNDTYSNITFNRDQKCYINREDGKLKETNINDNSIIYDSLIDLNGKISPTPVILTLIKQEVSEQEFYNGVYYKLFKQYYVDPNNNYLTEQNKYLISNEIIYEQAQIYDPTEQYYKADGQYYIAKFEYGDTPGYKLTNLTYAGELIAKAGETITSILDKIKKMLGDFEYFYNLDGKFVFQRQQKYNFSNWHMSEKDEIIYNDSTLNMEKPIFNLLDNKLLTSFKNSPKLTDMKNDYSVWGNRKMDSGIDRTIHARYAIDKKPIFYKNFDGICYVADKNLYNTILNQNFYNNDLLSFVDWREIIYQMSIDYYNHNHEDDFLYILAKNNQNYYPNGITGYERYYVDLNGFWRDLYNPDPEPQSIIINYKEANESHAADTLYIINSFRHLFEKEKDQEIINIEDLYVLDYSGEIDDEGIPSTPEIIPFLGSSYCHLNYNTDKTASDDVYFFEDDEGKMNSGVDDIAKLNEVNLYDIYIKERGPYITLEGYKNNIETMWEEIDAINSQLVTLTIEPNYYTEISINENDFISNQYYYFHTDNYKLATEYDKDKKYYTKQVASVSLTAPNGHQSGNSISVTMGTPVDCIVSQDGYITKIKQWRVYGNVIKTIILNKENSDNKIEEPENDSFANYADFIKYFSDIMQIREKYYSMSNKGEEDRRPFYVRGEIKPGEEWPKEESKSLLTFDNKVFLIRKTPSNITKDSLKAESIHKFWVFKYPFGTQLGEYPDDYTNYAALQLEKYLNQPGGWDNLYIRNKEPIKFSDLDQVIQRLYYKQAQYLTEYLNIVQYDNFNTLKTKLTTMSLILPQIAPSSFSKLEDYEAEIKNICKTYCGEYSQIGQDYVKAIYEIKRKNYDTIEEYETQIYKLYEEFLSKLQIQYMDKLNKPSFKTELVRYNKIYYNYNIDKENGDYWAKIISDSPEQLDFWFDFINGETSFLSKYSIQTIGPRSKVVNDTTVKAIYYKEVPNIIFITSQEEYENYDHQTGYTYIQLPSSMNNLFVTSSRGKSAKSAIEDLIYKHTYATETATIQTLPIYHLQPNTCLYIRNDETNINGDYLISKITVPLDQKKMMSITATKVMPSII